MTREDIDNIISIICPNDEDFEKPIISPAYLKKELEILALEQEPKSPCDLCRFNPPSSADGKPCTMCPAEGSEE